MNNELERYRVFNKLKTVYRFAMAGDRHESSAEHSWGTLILADFFLAKVKGLDRLKVYELLMYHDVVEIEAGDTPLIPGSTRADQHKAENEAAKILSTKLPTVLTNKYLNLFTEFQEQKTVESRFAKAVEAMEADIHELDYKSDWKGWTSEFLIQQKSHLFDEFPVLKESFIELVEYLEKNEYFQ